MEQTEQAAAEVLDIQTTILERLRALPEEEACQAMRDKRGLPMSRQYLWQIRSDPPRKPLSFRLFARAIARLGLCDEDKAIEASLRARFPEEFRQTRILAVVRDKPRRTRKPNRERA